MDNNLQQHIINKKTVYTKSEPDIVKVVFSNNKQIRLVKGQVYRENSEMKKYVAFLYEVVE